MYNPMRIEICWTCKPHRTRRKLLTSSLPGLDPELGGPMKIMDLAADSFHLHSIPLFDRGKDGGPQL